MKTKMTIAATAVMLLIATPTYPQPSEHSDAPTKPDVQYAPEDFGVGRRHTANAWCNRQIDTLLDETRRCYNAHPASECDALQKKNSKGVGGYIKSPHCAKR